MRICATFRRERSGDRAAVRVALRHENEGKLELSTYSPTTPLPEIFIEESEHLLPRIISRGGICGLSAAKGKAASALRTRRR